MPRFARLDAPGIFHPIIMRGIERRKIFRDKRDRENFLERLGKLLLETRTGCYAWAFLPNQAHFLLRTGEIPRATLVRRLLTGYVVSFNRRHKRQGHLLQNRYKSIVGQEETYLQENTHEDIPTDVVNFLDVIGPGDPSVPPRFRCEKCAGVRLPV